MKKAKVFLAASTILSMLITCSPSVLADQNSGASTNKSDIKSINLPIIMDYSAIKSKLQFKNFKFVKSSLYDDIEFDNATQMMASASSDLKITIDDIAKNVTLICKGETYVFPYVKINSFQDSFQIEVPNGLIINFIGISNEYNTTYKSSIKPISFSSDNFNSDIFKNSKYFFDYKEEFKKVFVNISGLNEESVKQLMCYLYLNDEKAFNDWLRDNNGNISSLSTLSVPESDRDVNISTDNDSIDDEDQKLYDDLSKWLNFYDLDINTFIDESNYDEDGNLKNSIYKQLRTQFINFLNKNTKIKSDIVSKANSAKAKLITVTCYGSIINDNGFESYLHIKNDYLTLNFDKKGFMLYIQTDDFTDENDISALKICNENKQEIYIIQLKKDHNK